MKVRVNIGKEMNLGFQIPDGMEYEFMLKVLQTGKNMTGGRNGW